MSSDPYNIGTITVANGATTVAGTETYWVGKVRKNDMLFIPSQGLQARVTATPSDNEAMAITAWPGTNLTDAAYEIIPAADATTSSARLRDLLVQLDIVRANGQGRFMRFGDSIADADPGEGYLRLNHLTIASATELYVDNIDGNGATISGWIDTWDDGTSITKGRLFLSSLADRAVFHVFAVSGSVVDGTGYRKVSFTYVGGSGSFANTDKLMMDFAAKGDRGDGFITDADAADPSGLTAYEAEAAGYLVFVTDLSTLFASAYDGCSGVVRLIAGPDWELAALYTGPQGDKGDMGWSPRTIRVEDGERQVIQLSSYVGGEGVAPTTDVGKYLKADGTWTATIGDALDVRGASFNWVSGGYNGANSYAKRDALRDQGASWIALQNVPPGNPPPTLPTASNAYWDSMALPGLNGAGTVASIEAGPGIAVDNTDPTAPIVSTEVQPSYYGALAVSGGALNARMFIENRTLALCEFGNSKVGLYSLRDKLAPTLITSFAVGTNPRDVIIQENWLFVACNGAAKVEIWDISDLATPILVTYLTTDASPKEIRLIGSHLFVVCSGTGKLQKWRIDRLSTNGVGAYDVSIPLVASVTVGTLPLSPSYNGANVMAVVGQSTVIYLINTDTLATSSLAVAGTEFSTCEFVGQDTLLATDRTNGRLYVINTKTFATPVVMTFVTVSAKPSQVLPIGNRAYIAQLDDAGNVAHLDVVDISDIAAPALLDSIALTCRGAGFLSYFDKTLYVSGHFTPFNIDILEVPDGRQSPDYSDFNEGAVFESVSGLIRVMGMRVRYRTIIANATLNKDDFMVRVGAGAALALHDPALVDGQLMLLKNVHGSSSSAVTNSYAGYSGTLTPGQSKLLIASTYAGTSQWEVFAQV